MRPENIKIRILVPFTLAIAFITAVFIFVTYRYMNYRLDEDWNGTIQKIQESFKDELDLDAEIMNVIMDNIIRDESLREALKNRDRAALLKEAQPLFRHYLAEHNITHLYFHGPDRVNILRVHQPERYGDRIDRFTLLEAEKIAQGKGKGYHAKGIELGPPGTFTNRVVFPWFEGKALIGYVEMGKELDRVLEELRKDFGTGLYIFIHKEFLDRGKWEEGMKMLGRKPDWERYPYTVNVSGPIEQVSEETIQTLAGKHLPHGVEKIEVKEKDRYYHFGKVPLVDAGGREVGHAVVFSEYTAGIGAVRSTVMLVSLVFIGVGQALFVFFYIITGRAERDLIKSRTNLERQYERVRESEERFRTVTESAGDAIIGLKSPDVIYLWNRKAEEIFGYTTAEAIGKNMHDLIVPERYREKALEGLKLFFGTGTGAVIGKAIEIEALRRNGEEFPVGLSISAVNIEGAWRAIGIVRDITERKKMEDQLKGAYNELNLAQDASINIMEDLERERKSLAVALKERDEFLGRVERANKELNDFAYIVSHDLKAPLRAISQLADWLAEDYTNVLDDAGKETLKVLKNRTVRMHNMIEGILQFSRVGRVEGKAEAVDTDKVVRQIIDSLAPPENIRIAVQDGLPQVVFDPLRINQIFQNLISNAIKYMDKPEGLIEIGCTYADSFHEFFVKDNGPGIEERHFERIFQIFQTLAARDEYESTGIGLSIVKKIIEQNGGRIWVESEVGKGSIFKFTIPKKGVA